MCVGPSQKHAEEKGAMQKGKYFHWESRQTLEKVPKEVCHVPLIDRNLNVFFKADLKLSVHILFEIRYLH